MITLYFLLTIPIMPNAEKTDRVIKIRNTMICKFWPITDDYLTLGPNNRYIGSKY